MFSLVNEALHHVLHWSYREVVGMDGGRTKNRTLTPENSVHILSPVCGQV